MIHICLITYKRLHQLVVETIGTFSDEDVKLSVVEGLRNEILEKEKRQMIERTDVIIAGGANARIAKENFSVPVLEYKITDFDYMSAVKRGLQYGKKVAIVSYCTPVSDRFMQYFLEDNRTCLVNLIYEDTEELYQLIEKSAVDVVVGAAHPVEIGEELGKRTVLIYPGKNSILESIDSAKLLALELQKARKKQQFMSAMMSYSTNGILFIDRDGSVIDGNRSAARMIGVDYSRLKGADISEVFPACRVRDFVDSGCKEQESALRVREHEIYGKMIRLEDRSMNYLGAVIMLTQLSQLKEQLMQQERAGKVRQEKGFCAKNQFTDMIGSSSAMKNCIEEAKFFSKSEASLLLYGETGVGKEIFAQSIHNYSERRNGNFIAINCAALPENLLESELFGYDEGAFTGGRRGGKKGLFEMADHGTIFLDEIGEISPMMQSRLLRVLQEKEVMHVGGDKIIPVDVRVISATNKNFEQMTDAQFRRDLLYRLSVLEVTVPPLRERERDVVELFCHFYRMKRDINLYDVELNEEAKKILCLYSWPGNIRELQNVCERFCLYLEMQTQTGQSHVKHCIIKAIGEKRLLKDMFQLYGYRPGEAVSKELVDGMKNVFSYNREQIAQLLGVSRTTIWRMLNQENKH